MYRGIGQGLVPGPRGQVQNSAGLKNFYPLGSGLSPEVVPSQAGHTVEEVVAGSQPGKHVLYKVDALFIGELNPRRLCFHIFIIRIFHTYSYHKIRLRNRICEKCSVRLARTKDFPSFPRWIMGMSTLAVSREKKEFEREGRGTLAGKTRLKRNMEIDN